MSDRCLTSRKWGNSGPTLRNKSAVFPADATSSSICRLTTVANILKEKPVHHGSGGTNRFDRPCGHLQIRKPPLECRPHGRSDQGRFLVLLAPLHSSATVAVLLVAGRRRGSPFPPPDGFRGLCERNRVPPKCVPFSAGQRSTTPGTESSERERPVGSVGCSPQVPNYPRLSRDTTARCVGPLVTESIPVTRCLS